MNLPKTEGNYIDWIVENLEGSRFNTYSILFGLSNSDMSWTLSGRWKESEEYLQIDKKTNYAVVDRVAQKISSPVGYVSMKMFRWTMDTSSTVVPRISEFVFAYCKPASEGICPGVDDYPTVSEGEISPSLCPEDYEGYSYRRCQGGVLQEVQTEHCIPKLPINVQYSQQRFDFVMNTQVSTGIPTYDHIVDSFYLDTGITLPDGLVLNEENGEISGVPTNITDIVSFTVYAKNQRGAAMTVVSFSVRKGICKAEYNFETTPVDEVFVFECSKQGSYIGKQTRRCVLGEHDGVWEAPSGSCLSIVLLVTIIIIAVLVIIVIIVILVKVSKKKKAVGGVKGKKVTGGTVSKDKKVAV